MPRIRTIKPEFPQSESMGNVSREARLLFILLWTLCDDEGRGRGSSRMLASLLYPYDKDAPELIDGWLAELENEGCVIRYLGDDGASYYASLNWSKHQKIDRPSKSRCPPPPSAKHREHSALPREGATKPREGSSLDQGPRTKEGIKDQGSRKGPYAEAVASGATAPPDFTEQLVQNTTIPPTGAPSPNRPPSADDKTWAFNEGLLWLEGATGTRARSLRPLLGKWAKETHDDFAKLRAIFEEAAKLNPVEPIAWITKAIEARADQHGRGGNGKEPGLQDDIQHWPQYLKTIDMWVYSFKMSRGNVWRGDFGKEPHEWPNTIPPKILERHGFPCISSQEKGQP